MGEVVYRSRVTVTRQRGPLRTATVPAEDRPVTFGSTAPWPSTTVPTPRTASRTPPPWTTWWPRPPGD
jgi:hypothetical protein